MSRMRVPGEKIFSQFIDLFCLMWQKPLSLLKYIL